MERIASHTQREIMWQDAMFFSLRDAEARVRFLMVVNQDQTARYLAASSSSPSSLPEPPCGSSPMIGEPALSASLKTRGLNARVQERRLRPNVLASLR